MAYIGVQNSKKQFRDDTDLEPLSESIWAAVQQTTHSIGARIKLVHEPLVPCVDAIIENAPNKLEQSILPLTFAIGKR